MNQSIDQLALKDFKVLFKLNKIKKKGFYQNLKMVDSNVSLFSKTLCTMFNYLP